MLHMFVYLNSSFASKIYVHPKNRIIQPTLRKPPNRVIEINQKLVYCLSKRELSNPLANILKQPDEISRGQIR